MIRCTAGRGALRTRLIRLVVTLVAPLFAAAAVHADDLDFRATPSRLDPRLRQFLQRYEEQRAGRLSLDAFRTESVPMLGRGTLSTGSDGRLMVDCLVMADAEGVAELAKLGVVPRTRAGNIMTASIAADDLPLLEEMPGLRAVEMSRPLKPLLDVSRALTGADMVNGAAHPPYPMSGYTGRNVVVGIVDTGIDLQHHDFINQSNNTRIEWVWDQEDDSGTHPGGFTYGREWGAGDIDAGTATEIDENGHGSHVAGIAAGNGSQTGGSVPQYTFVGIAPEATIIGVKTNFTTSGVTDAVNYIFAKSGVRDAVVNLSLGTQDGPHDGTSLFDQGLTALVGNGREIVAAAGNEGGAGVHARLIVTTPGDSAVFTFSIPPYTPNAGGTTQNPNDFVVIDGWYEGNDNFSFRAESPNGRRTTEVLQGANNSGGRCLPTTGGDGRCYVENSQSTTFNGDREIYLEMTEGTVGANSCGVPRNGTWKIIAYRKNGSTGPGVIDFWIANYLLGPNPDTYPVFVNGESNDHLVGSPASAAGVIGVGAFISKRQWQSLSGGRQYSGLTDADIGKIAYFSSPGPLRDGTLAPLLVAPGMGIGSTLSASASVQSIWTLTDGKHFINQGTSQASPHVAGVIALIYERYPHETPVNVRNRLALTANRDDLTGPDPNNTYGYGKLDAVGALDFDTPVLLSLFEALPDGDGITLHWVVQADEPFVGFHVLRGDAEGGPFVRLTTSPIRGSSEFHFTDSGLSPDRRYWYEVEAIGVDGSTTRFGPLAAVSGRPPLSLAQNGPNPFAAGTTISFTLPATGAVTLRVFDLGGRLVRTLIEGTKPVGPGEARWDGLDASGNPAPNGVYFYRLESDAGSQTRKMILRR